MRTALVTGIFLVVAAAALGACEPVAPTNPTWEQDIHPLMVARCIRCHNATPGRDPSVGPENIAGMIATTHNFDYPTVGELPQLVRNILPMLASCARGEPSTLMMPPPPAEKLEAWQIDMLAIWEKNPI